MRVERDSIAGKDKACPREIAGTVREDGGEIYKIYALYVICVAEVGMGREDSIGEVSKEVQLCVIAVLHGMRHKKTPAPI